MKPRSEMTAFEKFPERLRACWECSQADLPAMMNLVPAGAKVSDLGTLDRYGLRWVWLEGAESLPYTMPATNCRHFRFDGEKFEERHLADVPKCLSLSGKKRHLDFRKEVEL